MEYIHVKENIYKVPYLRSNGKKANRYYIRNICSNKECGKEHFQHISNNKKANGIGYCSVECSNISKTNLDGYIKYKRGSNSKEKHTLTKMVDHPFARKGFVPTHRLVMEKKLKRFLTKKEIVHHVDMISDNNDIENLYLCEGISEHNMSHASLNRCVRELLDMKVLIFKEGKYIVENNSRD